MYDAEFPYTDFNKVNLDWMCDKLKTNTQQIEQNTSDIEELKAGMTVIDYEDLQNLPEINGVTLIGDKSLDDIGAASADELSELKSAVNRPALYFNWADSPMQDGFNNNTFFDFEVGYILNGNNLERNYAIRTKEKLSLSGTYTVSKKNNTMTWFFVTYSSDGTYESTSPTIANLAYQFTADSNKRYRFCIRYTDTSKVMTVPDGISGYQFRSNEQRFNPEFYWLNPLIYFGGSSTGRRPQFDRISSVSIRITFIGSTTMYLRNVDGRTIAKSITFEGDTSYTVESGSNPLVWDIEENEIKTLDTNDLSNRHAVLFGVSYGDIAFGGLAPYYLSQDKALTTYNYPPYYNDNNYMSEKVGTIRGRQMDAGSHGDTFAFVTDTHWNKNRKHSPELMRSIVMQTQINKVIHGGDVPSAYQTEADMYENVRGDCEAWRYAVGDYLYRLLGNHDIHATDNADPENPVYTELTPDQVYGLMLSEQADRVTYNPSNLNGGYFCFDNKVQKIRYICLNNFETPNTPYMSNYQISWIGDRVLELDGAWNVVFIGHCSIIQSQNTDYAHYNDIRGMIEAIVNKHTFTASYGRTFDFTQTIVTVVGYFCGHKHADLINVYNGVTYVVTTCDALFQDDGYNRVANTISEQAFDVVTIDTSEKHVYLTRIGAGNDRNFTY